MEIRYQELQLHPEPYTTLPLETTVGTEAQLIAAINAIQ
jgi:hypothetical protein